MDINLGFLYPTKCVVCGKRLENQTAEICDICYNELTIIEEFACPKCGKHRKKSGNLCFDCKKENHLFNAGRGMLVYNTLTKKSLSGLKFFGYTWIGKIYGKLLAEYFQKWCHYPVDFVIPVPIHWTRYVQRGYNQAEVIAYSFSIYSQLDILPKGLKRIRHTKPQKELNEQERIQNLSLAFKVNKKYISDIQGKNVLIIDDIYTTGSTIDGCTKALRQAGASQVYFLTVAIGDGI